MENEVWYDRFMEVLIKFKITLLQQLLSAQLRY